MDARRDPRRAAADHARDAGPVRAADGQLRDDRRRRLPEGLLSRAGNRRSRAVSRSGEAPYGACARAGRRLAHPGPGVQRRHGGRCRALRRRRRAPGRRADLNYYVYYKVDVAQLAELRPAVERLFALLERECGVRGRWMHRRDDAATYMEVYEDVKDAARFEALLEREGAKLGMPRRLERFVCA